METASVSSATPKKSRPMSEDALLKAHNTDALDSVERLSLGIIGKLAMTGTLTFTMIHDEGLYWLFEDICAALEDGIKHVDMVEIRKTHEGKRAKNKHKRSLG